MLNAPLFHDIAQGPDGGQAYWLTATDAVRLRAGHWPAASGSTLRGSVLLFPGRTEYIEKYGIIAKELSEQGYHTLTVDWRGQGLADRPEQDRILGHVGDFAEYQLDVQAFVDLARQLDLPRPWYLIGHSMGGCIGLRALLNNLPVEGAIFSAPMWGISMAPVLRPVAWSLSWALHMSPFKHMLTPGTQRETYLSLAPFADNLLTTDPEMYRYMKAQAEAHPELTLGGPTAGWLYAALSETRALMLTPPPKVRTVTFLGSCERIVQAAPIHDHMQRWHDGKLVMIEGAEHEVLMESAEIRQRVYDSLSCLSSQQPSVAEPA
ncbi:alpha/beta hydrolase [Aliiroseovarius crassostreae]|uniref:alpha/beta fold hydrolase n=1 Tax=Aliiroseovarius crassostreae TaxID=154981 RepID=UPI0021FA2CC2|nr:alpha/beta hydrolase [Aliiroseovarius crassostreae]UWQ06698.1 alpha/beta hydrolase [Aliiroseovarius crassostreae]UWQ12480.1 alpha/beta hydrolase [Aliiroseovarius crassostreae]